MSMLSVAHVSAGNSCSSGLQAPKRKGRLAQLVEHLQLYNHGSAATRGFHAEPDQKKFTP